MSAPGINVGKEYRWRKMAVDLSTVSSKRENGLQGLDLVQDYYSELESGSLSRPFVHKCHIIQFVF